MIDLSDVTFTIPVKIDQPNRARNIRLCVEYILQNFKTNIIVCEMDKEPKIKDILGSLSYTSVFMKTDSPYIHRTMMLNYMAKMSKTPIIVNYDCDIMLPVNSYIIASKLIRENQFDLVYPYDGAFWDVSPQTIEVIQKTKDVNFINVNAMCKNLRPSNDSVGGAVFWNKEKFMQIGMENETFVSWGYEDYERVERAAKFNMRIGRIADKLFHLHHEQSLNSTNGSHPFYKKNEQEWLKVRSMKTEDLKSYVKSWTWNK